MKLKSMVSLVRLYLVECRTEAAAGTITPSNLTSASATGSLMNTASGTGTPLTVFDAWLSEIVEI